MYTLNKNQMFVTDKLLIATPEGKKMVVMVMVGLQQNI